MRGQMPNPHRRLPLVRLPAALLGVAAILLIASGALVLNHQLRTHERQRAMEEARQLAFGLSREASERFWRFREEFIFSLTHLPYQRLLDESESSPETLVPVRRFLALNQDILKRFVVTGADGRSRTISLRGENYVVVSPITPSPDAGGSTASGAAPQAGADSVAHISGIVQDSAGSVRARVQAILNPDGFLRGSLTSFGLSHPSLWIHLMDAGGVVTYSRHGGEQFGDPPILPAESLRRLQADAREGYEGRLLHAVRHRARELALISAYVPVRIEQWTGVLMVSSDEAVVLGPAARAIGTLATISVALFITLLAIFLYFFRINLRNQRQLEESRRLAEDSAREAEAANQAKSTFLAMMSHELRTPLNSILGLSETLVEGIHGPLNEKQNRYLRSVLTSGRLLLNLINDILDLAKIESGRMDIEREHLDLREIGEQSVALIQPMANQRNQKLELILPPSPIPVHADARLFKQLLVNLLGNAVKFTPEGGELGLKLTRLSTFTGRIEVWDKGIGIAAENQERIFRPFVQLDARLSRDYGGTGLGLALVRQIAQLHGGKIVVQSQPGQGSVFTLDLPLEKPRQSPAPELEPPSIAQAMANTTRWENAPVILIVDDTALNVLPVKDYLEHCGCRTLVAGTGAEALTLAETHHPDLILMDIQLPDLDGIEATRRLRAAPGARHARTPIVAMTALAMPSDRERCRAAGMDDYLSKPFNLSDLALIISKHLKTGNRTQPFPRLAQG